MKIIQKIFIKKIKPIEENTIKKGKKTVKVAEYQLICDDEVNEQHTLKISADNKEVLEKLQDIELYTPLFLISEVNLCDNKTTKIEVIDIIENTYHIDTVDEIIDKYIKN